MSEHQKNLEPNPKLNIEDMAGADISIPLAWLAGRMVDSLVVDGHNFVFIGHQTEGHDGRVQVVCTAEDGASLLLDYNPTDRNEPVCYSILQQQTSD